MKKTLFLFLVFYLGVLVKNHAQFSNEPDSTFYSFLDTFYHYHQDDSTEGGMYNHVRRDVLSWGGRLYPSGDMKVANKALIEYSKIYNTPPTSNPITLSSGSSIQFPINHPNATGWNELGPTGPQSVAGGRPNTARGMGQMHRIAFHPAYDGNTKKTVYAGSHYGGLFRSDDGGANWYNFHTDQGLPITSIGGVAVSDYKVYVCTGNGDYGFTFGYQAYYQPFHSLLGANPTHTVGVYRYDMTTTNQWEDINGAVTMIDGTTASSLLDVFEGGGTMREIIVHPTNDNIVLIATSHGIFKTINSGNNWTQVLIGPSVTTWDTEWRGLEFHPTNSNIVYASGRDIYQSTDGGNTWTSMTNGTIDLVLPTSFDVKRINVATTPAKPNNVYAQIIGNTGRRLYLYDGTSWLFKAALTTPSEGFENPSWNGIAVSPVDGSDVFIGAIVNHRCQNFLSLGTVGFNRINATRGHDPAIHHDVHVLEFPPNNLSNKLFFGTHGGISEYDLTTSSWRALYNGLGVSTIWTFDDWEGKYGVIALAKQDIGVDYTRDNGQIWFAHDLIGDGYGVQIDDHSGLSFWIGSNGYVGIRNIYPSFSTPTDISPRIPFDPGTGDPSFIPSTFKMINHPKTEELYFGLSELHRRGFLTAIEQNAGGGIYPWTPKSDIYQAPGKSAQWTRQIMEVAFSEDENTDNAYVSTLNYTSPSPTGSRFRSGFFVSDQSVCSTCFVDKTGGVPVSTNPNIPANYGDPNPITGIAVDPLNGDRVWVTFTGFDPTLKVYYSSNKGDANTWVSYDDANQSLANMNMSVNGIVYQRGTNDRLYIATDVGIFVRENGGNWLRFDNAVNPFPNTRVTELKINYCSGKLLAATFGRGVWEADLLPAEEDINLRSFRVVDNNETWNTDKNMTRDIRVKQGATLTLSTMTLNMPAGGLIVVETGAKLVVDGSTITNLCGETWVGIQIWGDDTQEQTSLHQGHLVLNGATVEYAKEAMSPWEVDNPNGTGGIVEATNSTFVNNWRTSGFMRYNSPSGQREKSRFANCTFTVNDDIRPFNNQPNSFLGHLSMWDISGILIEGCTFKDERSSKTTDSYGIYTLSATPNIRGLQQGSILNPRKPNTFEGLERAVEIGNPATHNFTTQVDQAIFIDNEQALTIRNHDNATIIRNSFEIGGFPNNVPPSSGLVQEYGLGFINSGSFVAQQNNFEANNTTDPTIGSWIDETGDTGNDIINNNYTNLTGAILAHGQNANPQIIASGSQFLCNESSDNTALDYGVLDNTNGTNTPSSINTNQGSNSAAARNTFSGAVSYHFFNFSNTISPIDYWFDPNGVNETPDPSRLLNVQDFGIPANNQCIDQYTDPNTTSSTGNNGGPMLRSTMKNNHYAAVAQYNQLKSEYDGKIDNGDTEALLLTIEETPPSDKGSLKVYLLDIAPFLSQEVLLFTAGRGLYNSIDLKEIIKANPDVIKATNFMEDLALIENSPLEENDLEEIENSPTSSQESGTPTFERAELGSQIAQQYRLLNFWAGEVYKSYANDTIVSEPDTLMTWIQNKKGLSAAYELVEYYWRTGQEALAFSTLASIANSNELEGVRLQNHTALVELKTLYQTVAQDNRTIAQLEREEVVQLEAIANLKAGTASSQAANIVSFFYTPSTRYYPMLPDLAGRSNFYQQEEGKITTVTTSSLSGYPNPAINWVDLIYELPSGKTEGIVYITASNGQLIEQIKVNQIKGSINLNTTPWTAGIYFASLWTADNQQLQVYKIVIKK